MNKQIIKKEDVNTGNESFGKKAWGIVKAILDHPLTKVAVVGCIGGIISNNVMKNQYDATEVSV